MNSKRVGSAPLPEVWERFVATGDPHAQEEILIAYTPLVERIAREIMRKKPSNFDHEDLSQSGMIGLINAIDRFDPERGVLFSTFASRRIYGAIYDEINKMDWTPRLVRERIKMVLRATENHYRNNQHIPSPEEISVIISETTDKTLTPEQVVEAREQAMKTYVHAVDTATALQQEESHPGFSTVQKPDSVEDSVAQNELSALVDSVINEVCVPFEALVIRETMLAEKSMKQLADELRVPVSRVSSARKVGLCKIAEALVERGISSPFGWSEED